MSVRPYLLSFSLFAFAVFSMLSQGILTYTPTLYAFVFIPLMELLIRPDHSNLSEQKQKQLLANKTYDYLLYAALPIHFFCLALFLYQLNSHPEIDGFTKWGWISSLGILNGVFGINVAHELGHRPNKTEQYMAKALLMSTLYMHFFIEHNRGHHRYVATKEDPATARKWEPVYLFWFRSIFMSWFSAWKLEAKRLQRKRKSAWSFKNEMIQFSLIQSLFLLGIYSLGGMFLLTNFLASAAIGIILLETVNYIEHYALKRKKVSAHRFEDVQPKHSWNSNHRMGRWMLFELSRHSDHHHRPARKYQILEHHKDSPQMPSGYPGMMLISLIPPLFFAIIHPKLPNSGESTLSLNPS